MQFQKVEGAIDPNVAIPQEVVRLASKANEAYERAYGKPPAQEPPPVAPPAEPPAEPKVEPPVVATPEPPAEPTVQPTAPVEPPVAPSKDPPSDWEHQYKSMKGRYERAQGTIDSLTAQLASLQARITQLEVAPPAPKPTPAVKKLVTEEEERDYGADLLGVVGKKAREVVDPLVLELEERLKTLDARLNSVNTQNSVSSEQRMYETLNEKLPNWGELNNNPDFIRWLGLPDVYSGVIRHELLSKAHKAHNAPQVLAFFNGFLAEEAATDPAKGVKLEVEVPAPVNGAAQKIPLETFAAPGRAKSAAANSQTPVEKPLISRADIGKFYVEVNQGVYRGRDVDKARREAEIFLAQREGRIVN